MKTGGGGLTECVKAGALRDTINWLPFFLIVEFQTEN